MRLFFRLIVACLLQIPTNVLAEENLSERFEVALEIWLSDNDKDSLPEFAQLAGLGHRDAQLFLARLEHADLGPSAYRRGLSARESRKLFRTFEGTGPLGRTWLQQLAKENDPLANAFLASRIAVPDPERVLALAELGELEATHYAARLVALYGDQAQKQTLAEMGAIAEGLIPFFDFLEGEPEPLAHGFSALRHVAADPELKIDFDNQEAREMANYLAFGQQFGAGSNDNQFRPYVDDWLRTADYVRPIQAYCDQNCPLDSSDCAFMMLGLSDGYYGAIRLDTPTETVLPQSRFLGSLRAQNMAMRRAALARTDLWEFVASIGEIAEVSECLAAKIEEVRAE
jgi:hypothetical protein